MPLVAAGRRRRSRHGPGQRKIRQLGRYSPFVVEQYVLGLDVAMNQADRVDVAEAPKGLKEDRPCLGIVEGALLRVVVVVVVVVVVPIVLEVVAQQPPRDGHG